MCHPARSPNQSWIIIINYDFLVQFPHFIHSIVKLEVVFIFSVFLNILTLTEWCLVLHIFIVVYVTIDSLIFQLWHGLMDDNVSVRGWNFVYLKFDGPQMTKPTNFMIVSFFVVLGETTELFSFQ